MGIKLIGRFTPQSGQAQPSAASLLWCHEQAFGLQSQENLCYKVAHQDRT
jgi:hypothetical protein